MERSRIIAVACALVAFVLVLIAGKSCTDDAVKKKQQNMSEKTTAATYTVIYPGYGGEDASSEPVTYATNELGMPIIPTTTAVQLDLFGRPVTTEAETTDEDTFTAPVQPEPATDENGEPVTSEPDTTAPPRISGYDHGQYDDEGNPLPTLPSDFVLIIE